MEYDCITLSDDDEVEFLEQVFNVEPPCVDLTEDNSPKKPARPPTPPVDSPKSGAQQGQQIPNGSHSPNISQPHIFIRPHNQFTSFQPNNSNNCSTQFTRNQHYYINKNIPKKPDLPREQFHHENRKRPHISHSPPHLPTQPPPPPPTPPQPQTRTPTPPRSPSPPPQQPTPPQESPSEQQEDLNQPTETHPESSNEEGPKKPQISDRELMMSQKALGNELYKKHKFDEAIRVYKRCVELAKRLSDNEMSAILHFNLAMSYCNLKFYDQAADQCSHAVKLNDKYLKAHLKRAEIYQRQFKFEEAVICYEHICELDPNNEYSNLLRKAREAAKHTQKKDPYAVLGLRPNCNKLELKKAYRQSALKHHPDRHSNADTVTRRIEEKYFKDAQEAHNFIQKRFCNY